MKKVWYTKSRAKDVKEVMWVKQGGGLMYV